jgi:putative PIN family toxin of toxin-antitoxin system
VSAALSGLLQWCASSAILAEYEEVLRRAKFPLNQIWIDRYLTDIRRVAKLIEPSHIVKKLTDDPDNRILECANAAQADFLVTGNTRPHAASVR